MILDEHFGYISDHLRTERFDQALARVVRPGDLVADLGCGFGILGMMCLQAGAAHCWGIDRTDAIGIARETMDRAGFGDRYSCLRESTYRAVLPQPVDLIVCDHVGYFGLDYGIVGMVQDARRRLLKPGGRVMPRRIGLHLAAVSSPEIRAKARPWSAPGIPRAFHWLDDYAANTKQACQLQPEALSSGAARIGEVNLGADNPEYFAFSTTLELTRDGPVDGLLGWFDCELAEGVWMSNSPLDPHAIDRDQAFLPLLQPVEGRRGDLIEAGIRMRPQDGLLAWNTRFAATGRVMRQSTWQSIVIDRDSFAAGDGAVAELGLLGAARLALGKYIDGKRTRLDVADAFARDHPHLMPTVEETRRFVLDELALNARR